ncbi:MAG: hypothetical protein R3362_09025, partial [Rhodothermales bacterium]|nr:hypothetical protein [Rhodothermales bacterium]
MPPLRRLPFCAALVALAVGLPACGILPGFGGDEEDLVAEGAHVVFLTRADCDYVVAKTQGGRFAVLAPTGDYRPRLGDLLVGNLREGPQSLPVVP